MPGPRTICAPETRRFGRILEEYRVLIELVRSEIHPVRLETIRNGKQDKEVAPVRPKKNQPPRSATHLIGVALMEFLLSVK